MQGSEAISVWKAEMSHASPHFEPSGPKMGRIVLGRGHMALLPKDAAYQFQADTPSVLTIQTIQGELTIEKWADICFT